MTTTRFTQINYTLATLLDRVHELMKAQLNEHDLAVLTSDGVTPRWRNTAQWARNSLREDGLIRDDTPRSVWEISGEGRAWLAAQQQGGCPVSA